MRVWTPFPLPRHLQSSFVLAPVETLCDMGLCGGVKPGSAEAMEIFAAQVEHALVIYSLTCSLDNSQSKRVPNHGDDVVLRKCLVREHGWVAGTMARRPAARSVHRERDPLSAHPGDRGPHSNVASRRRGVPLRRICVEELRVPQFAGCHQRGPL